MNGLYEDQHSMGIDASRTELHGSLAHRNETSAV